MPHDDTNTHENELATAPFESVETQTAHIGTRVVQPSITKHRDITRRRRSKGSTQQTPQQATTKPTRARKQSQYKWSSVGRDAFDVAQQQVPNNHDSSRASDQRFERGEGGGVT